MPLSVWNWQDSLRAVLSEKAYVVSEFEDLTIRWVNNVFNGVHSSYECCLGAYHRNFFFRPLSF